MRTFSVDVAVPRLALGHNITIQKPFCNSILVGRRLPWTSYCVVCCPFTLRRIRMNGAVLHNDERFSAVLRHSWLDLASKMIVWLRAKGTSWPRLDLCN